MNYDYTHRYKLPHTKFLENAIDSVLEPVQHFMDLGFYYDEQTWWLKGKEGAMGDTQVRRLCRQIAKEQKKPFVSVEMVHTMWSNSQQLDMPVFHHLKVTIPRRKYLVKLISPLVLADGSPHIDNRSGETVWTYFIKSNSIAGDYLQFLRTDKDVASELRVGSHLK